MLKPAAMKQSNRKSVFASEYGIDDMTRAKRSQRHSIDGTFQQNNAIALVPMMSQTGTGNSKRLATNTSEKVDRLSQRNHLILLQETSSFKNREAKNSFHAEQEKKLRSLNGPREGADQFLVRFNNDMVDSRRISA